MMGETSMPPRLGSTRRNRPQQRLRQGVQEIPHRADDVVAEIDDVEGQQPRHDRRSDDDIAVEIENAEDEVEEREHRWSMAGTRNQDVRLRWM